MSGEVRMCKFFDAAGDPMGSAMVPDSELVAVLATRWFARDREDPLEFHEIVPFRVHGFTPGGLV